MERGLKKISVLLENHEKDLSWNNGNIQNWVEAWYELIYCILAGSKVHTKVVQKSYEKLIMEDPEKVLFTSLILRQEEGMKYLKKTLKESGYRFYDSKSETILNAAFFYITVYHDLESKKIGAEMLRADLVSNVKGIGIKIATHWMTGRHEERLILHPGCVLNNVNFDVVTRCSQCHILRIHVITSDRWTGVGYIFNFEIDYATLKVD